MTKQKCNTCNTEKEISEFHFRKERGYYFTNCKRCRRLKQISRTYNINLSYAKKLLNTNKCGICETYVEGQNQHVDHCHETGKVRDILCNNCNRAIGYFNEDINRIKKSIKYLNKHK